MDAKLHVLKDRTAKSKGDAKALFQQRADELRKAWERTKERWGATPSAER